jgi:hypothetical protein
VTRRTTLQTPLSNLQSTNIASIARLNSTSPTISSLTVGQPCIITTCHLRQWRRGSHPRPLPNRLLIIASCQNVSPLPHTSFVDKFNTTHPVFSHLNHPCIHSLQLSILAFYTLHPSLPCTGRRCLGNSLACRMFSYSCTVWVSLPHALLGPYSFPESIAVFLLSPLEHSPRTCDSYHPFPFILLLVRHTTSPSASSTCSSCYHPFPPTRADQSTTLLFIIGRPNGCVYFLLFYSFNSIVLLFIHRTPLSPPPPPSSSHRCGQQSPLRSILLPVTLPSLSSVGNTPLSVLHRLHRSPLILTRWASHGHVSIYLLVPFLVPPSTRTFVGSPDSFNLPVVWMRIKSRCNRFLDCGCCRKESLL